MYYLPIGSSFVAVVAQHWLKPQGMQIEMRNTLIPNQTYFQTWSYATKINKQKSKFICDWITSGGKLADGQFSFHYTIQNSCEIYDNITANTLSPSICIATNIPVDFIHTDSHTKGRVQLVLSSSRTWLMSECLAKLSVSTTKSTAVIAQLASLNP